MLDPNITYDPWMMVCYPSQLPKQPWWVGKALRKATIVIPFSEGGLTMHVGNLWREYEIPLCHGISATVRSRVSGSLWKYWSARNSQKKLSLVFECQEMPRGVRVAYWKEEEDVSLSSPKQIVHSTNTFEHALVFLKYMVNEHVFMNWVLLVKITKLMSMCTCWWDYCKKTCLLFCKSLWHIVWRSKDVVN
jgi:hypothetical protein